MSEPNVIGQNVNDPQIPENQKKKKKDKPKKSLQREILEWVLTLAAAVVIAVVVRSYGFELVRVDGHSMDYTLADGETMMVTKFDYVFGKPQRFDVVICHYPNRRSPGLLGIESDTNFVKRIVGLPGDKIAVEAEVGPDGKPVGVLYVNGERYDEPYLVNRINYYLMDTWDTRSVVYTVDNPYVVPDGTYFVLGDNRSNSNDSHIVGPLDASMIVGHVRAVLWPTKNWRGIPNGLDYKAE